MAEDSENNQTVALANELYTLLMEVIPDAGVPFALQILAMAAEEGGNEQAAHALTCTHRFLTSERDWAEAWERPPHF